MTMTENMIAEIDDLKEKNRLLRETLEDIANGDYLSDCLESYAIATLEETE